MKSKFNPLFLRFSADLFVFFFQKCEPHVQEHEPEKVHEEYKPQPPGDPSENLPRREITDQTKQAAYSRRNDWRHQEKQTGDQ